LKEQGISKRKKHFERKRNSVEKTPLKKKNALKEKKNLEGKQNPDEKDLLKQYVAPMCVPSLRNVPHLYRQYATSQVCTVIT